MQRASRSPPVRAVATPLPDPAIWRPGIGTEMPAATGGGSPAVGGTGGAGTVGGGPSATLASGGVEAPVAPAAAVGDGRAVSEKCGDEHAVGMTKFYRTACFQQIGGFVKELMWDGIDTHRSRMLGWKAASWDGEHLRFIHLRPMGTSQKNWVTGRMRHGRGQYYMGTGPGYMAVSALNRMLHPPLILGGLAMYWGYLKAAFTRGKRYDDAAFRRFVRSYQRACLLKGKDRATQELEDLQATVWRPTEK